MTKSSAVLFILIFSLIFKLEELVRPSIPSASPTPTDTEQKKGGLNRRAQPSQVAETPVAEEG